MKRILLSAMTAALVTAAILGIWTTQPQIGVIEAKSEFIRWDIVSVAPPVDFDIDPGGISTARDLAGNPITITGSGTFVAPRGGRSNAVTGGGTWDTGSDSGTYEVTSLVSWVEGNGSVVGSPLNDNIGNPEDSRAGLAVLTVEFDDGTEGVLTVSCKLPTTPPGDMAIVFEGIIVTKDYVSYWNPDQPAGGVDANRTIFHVVDHP
ncbi:MAG TPA: hypothetical protein VFR55_12285 [Dehalococcoidia bacterium]|nr:hypothetical protein [Dehalococcoidia bacterium]